MLEANITNIQHFNVHDGPGIRTVVFFQGCHLRCRWCQNPETISSKVRIMYDESKCIGCGACITSCPEHAIRMQGRKIVTNKLKCTHCGTCQEECFAQARRFTSETKTLEEVYSEVMKDEIVYRKSGGGLTVSGGEPLLHMDFVKELLKKVKAENIKTAVETAGFVPRKTLDEVMEYVDTFLFDFKLFHAKKHRYWVGADNRLIKDNLRYVCEKHSDVIIRIPLIPTVNDSEEEFSAMMDFLKECRFKELHLLPFHNLGAGKYKQLGEQYGLEKFSEENGRQIEICVEIAKQYGFKVNIGGAGCL